ncbi:MAG: hypothetical protein KIT11_01580 [Fimbriimonadaceae bacterium]|nr:hypothetical protein [Fimbriimonadaceae bacterium]QYK54939.1 MAG: hypothetical protein KF733_07955 [Fimbriimonadaceae bacterium]
MTARLVPILALAAVAANAAAFQDPLLDSLSMRAFQFFWNESNSSTGFTKDRAANQAPYDNYTVSSVASTGFALAAYGVGAQRGWVDREAAVQRATSVVYTLRTRSARKNGWFYHFVDWRNGSRVWQSEVSSIDTCWLLMGALLAERALDDAALTAQLNALFSEIDWHWMLTNGGLLPQSLTFSHGWKPEGGFLPYRWDSYSEMMALYVLGAGAWPGMPVRSWTAWSRPVVNYNGYRFLVGGPLFLHQMSHAFIDFSNSRDTLNWDYFDEARQATLANRLYCLSNPGRFTGYGPSFWGLSAGDTPDGYRANGAPGWISDNGTVNPAATVASVMFTPLESTEVANYVRVAFPSAYGRYGFANGINPTRNWIGPDVIGIDLGMMMLAIENARDGLPQRLTMSHPIIQEGMRRTGFRRIPIRSGISNTTRE